MRHEVWRLSPHPLARAAATVLGVLGTLLSVNPWTMAAVWLGVLLPVIIAARIYRQHAIFVLAILAPISLQLFLVWGLVVGAAPGTPVGSSPSAGLAFAARTTIRIALLAAILQLSVLTIRPERLVYTFTRCGVRGDWLVAALGTFALGPELALRAQQVLTARYSRGLAPDRRLLTRMRQMPYLLRPLFAWVLRSSIQRSEAWHQRHLIRRLTEANAGSLSDSLVGSFVLLSAAMVWCLYGLFW